MATEPHSLPFEPEVVQDQLDEIFAAARKFQFKTATGLLSVLLTKMPGLKSSVRVYRNELVSFSEGITDGTIAKKAVIPMIDEANTGLLDAYTSLLAELTKESTKDDVLYDLGPTALKEYDKNMNAVQTRITKDGTFVGYVPILPLTQPPLDPRKLSSYGIKAETFAGYCIMKKQLVAGISNDMLRPPKAIADKKSDKELAKIADERVEEFRKLILKRHSGMKLVEIANPISWWGARWLWLMPNSDVKLLARCTINSTTVASVKVTRWSFPFAR